MAKVTREHTEARRRGILRAALACLAQRGFHRTTMRAIAREAGLSTGAVYTYFRSKRDIVATLARISTQEAPGLLGRLRESGTAIQGLTTLVSWFTKALRTAEGRDRGKATLALWAEALRDPRVRKAIDPAGGGSLAPMVSFISDGQAVGEIRSDIDPSAVAWMMTGLLQAMITISVFHPDLDLAAMEQVAAHLISGLGPGGGRAPAGPGSAR
jgi:AcrR family transcriptional regulator